MDPRANGNNVFVLVSSCPLRIYMVIGWGSLPFRRYDPRAETPGVRMDPAANYNDVFVLVSSCPLRIYMVLWWESQPFISCNPRAKLPRP